MTDLKFINSSIAGKLWAWFLVVAVIPVALVVIIHYYQSTREIKHEVSEMLNTLTENKTEEIMDYFKWRMDAIRTLALNPSTIQACEKSIALFEKYKGNSSYYKLEDMEIMRYLLFYKEQKGYHDICFVSNNGDVVFSLVPGPVLGTNLFSGRFKDTEMALAFKNAVTLMECELSDYRYFPPSEAPAAFIASPVRKDNKLIGVMVFQLDIGEINALAGDYTGLGETGEIVITSKADNKAIVLTPLRHDHGAAFKRTITFGSSAGLPSQKAAQGYRGAGVFKDYRGKEVFAVWRYLPLLRWGIVVKIDISEAFAPIYALTGRYLLIGVISAIAVFFISFFVSRSITRPIRKLNDGVNILADGNLDYTVEVKSNDEIGRLAGSFNDMVARLKQSNSDLVNDIAERNRAEKTLRENEEKFRNLADRSPNMIFINKKGRVVYANRKCEEIMGYSREEIYSDDFNFMVLISPKDIGLIRKSFARHMSDEENPPLEYELITREGKKIQAILSTKLIDFEGEHAILGVATDISDRKQAEMALYESEERYRFMFENNPQPMFIYDLETLAFLQVNIAATEFYGYSKEEFLSMTLKEIHPAEDLEKLIADIEKTRKSYNPTGEWRNQKKNGELTYVETVAHSVTFNNRPARHILINDITERKKAGQALKENEEKYRLMVDLLPDAIIIHSGGKILFANTATLKLLGADSFDQILNRTAIDFVHPDYRDIAMTRIKKIYETGDYSGFALEKFLKLNNEVIDVEVIGIPVSYYGKPAVQTIVRDITGRKKADEELLKLKKAVDTSGEAIFLTDPDGVIIYVNPEFTTLYGFTAEEVVGKNTPRILKSGMMKPEYYEEFWRLIMNKQNLKGEYINKSKDGRLINIEGSASAIIDDMGSTIGYLAIQRDINERKLSEEKITKLNEELEQRVLDRTAQLEASNRELEAFTYTVSHDLRAPVRALNSFASILLEDYAPVLDDEGRRLLRVVADNATNMGRLIDNLLSFSRLGKQEIVFSRIDMHELVNSVYRDISSEKDKREIDFRLNDIPMAYGDPSLVRQVWVNLIGNALKFTATKPERRIEIGSTTAGMVNTYIVKDNGAGFNMAYSDKLFKVFQRLHDAREFEGTGVGLAIVQRIIHRLGGQVWAEGKINQGATFHFTLPNQRYK